VRGAPEEQEAPAACRAVDDGRRHVRGRERPACGDLGVPHRAAIAAERVYVDAGGDEGGTGDQDLHALLCHFGPQAVEETVQRVLAGA